MRTRLFLLFALAAATIFTNVATAVNIAHGVKVVVIDPGHGGRIPGAHYGGTYEKDIVLGVALKLGKMIEEGMPGVKVVYTRSTDKMLGADIPADLQERANIANRANGDLFLSIHANAAPKATGVRGVETLIMGESSKEQRYNQSALYENNREDLIDMSDERTAAIVRAYIQNLQFTYGEYSMAMARCIQNNYLQAGRHSRGVKPQLLRVLYATDMPGVLTEIGFMSNAQELAFMRSEKGQGEIARSLYESVKDYSAYVLEIRKAEEGTATPTPSTANSVDQTIVDKEPVRVSGKDKRTETKESTKKTVLAIENELSESETSNTKTLDSAATPDLVTSNELPVRVAPKSNVSRPTTESGGAAVKQNDKPLRYTVQVVASPKAIPVSSSQFKSYRGKVKQYTSQGTFRYKYGVGEYGTRTAAQKQLTVVRKTFPGAFVVSCRGTEIVK